MHCFKTQIGTGMFKRIINQFSFSDLKSRKKAFSRTLIRAQGLQPGWLSSRWNACPVLKRSQSGKVFKEFSGTTCTLMVKESPFSNGNLSFYIENITRWREDMNFMFEWQEQYVTSERSERVRYCSCHENIKFISSS